MMSPDAIPRQIKPIRISVGRPELAPSLSDQVGPMTFKVQLVYADSDRLRLQVVAERDGKKVVIWNGVEEYDASGRAVLPFWSKRLIMTHQYDKSRESYTVQAVLASDGTGGSWRDPNPSPAPLEAQAKRSTALQ